MAEIKPLPLVNAIPEELVPRMDPVYVDYYNRYNAGRLHTHQIPLELTRKNPSRYSTPFPRSPGVEVYRVSEQKCPVKDGAITVRIFEPGPIKEGDKPRPAYVNYHGGGWTFGNLELDDPFNRRVCKEIGCVVFDVDYRLAPEFRFPIPLEDSWAALNWVYKSKASEFNLDVNRIAIGGISAGSQMCAVLGHMARDAGLPLAFQLLAVPGIDLVVSEKGELEPDCPYESYRELVDAPALPVERIAFAYNHYLGVPRPKDWKSDWRISPLKAPSFEGLAPALVITAEMDPLRDEGKAYADKLEKTGNKVQHIRYPGVPHPFMLYDSILDAAKQYHVDVINALKEAFDIKN